jgi:hypothetical protein
MPLGEHHDKAGTRAKRLKIPPSTPFTSPEAPSTFSNRQGQAMNPNTACKAFQSICQEHTGAILFFSCSVAHHPLLRLK